MDWDDARPIPKKQIIVGEVLTDLSVGELNERIRELREEIKRVETELKAKQSQNAAADNLFRS